MPAPCISGKELELEMFTAILVADHPHIAFIEEDGGQHLYESSEDGVVVVVNLEIAFSVSRANWEVDRGRWTLGWRR